MRKETEELLHEIAASDDICPFFEENDQDFLYESADEFLREKLREKNIAKSDVAKNFNHGDYVYKVVSGERKPSRDILISIAFGLRLDVQDTQMLLRLAGTARLDPRKKRDAVTLYALLKGYDILHLNELLYDMGLIIY